MRPDRLCRVLPNPVACLLKALRRGFVLRGLKLGEPFPKALGLVRTDFAYAAFTFWKRGENSSMESNAFLF